MKLLKSTNLLLILLLINVTCDRAQCAVGDIIKINTLEQLVEYSSKDNVVVEMTPGVYQVNDDALCQRLTIKKVSAGRESDYNIAAILNFSGNNSHFKLNGVTIDINPQMHRAFDKRHLFEVFVSGNNLTIEGLKVRDNDNVKPIYGAIMMHVSGDGNTIVGADLFISGSYPYGYGHLLGKGANKIVAAQKHSSLLVSGKDTKLINCKVVTHAFGHGIVMQGAVNTLLKGCYVEGRMRLTDDMLKETSGPAFSVDFKSDYPPGVIVPGEMKALSEDGIRSYPSGYNGRSTAGTTVIDCTVKNMRSGYDLSAQRGPVFISNCEAIGCQEKGYSLPSAGVIERSRGDAMYGPLITFITKDIKNCVVDLELIPTLSDVKINPVRLAEINGYNNKITIKSYKNMVRTEELPIVFGDSFWADVHRFRSPQSSLEDYVVATGVTLINLTGMPIVLTERSQGCDISSNGKLISDKGVNNRVSTIK